MEYYNQWIIFKFVLKVECCLIGLIIVHIFAIEWYGNCTGHNF